MLNPVKCFEILRAVADDVVPVSRAKLAAMVWHKDRIISIGTNQSKSHPFAAKYARNPEAYFLHAETDAILRAKRYLSDVEFRKSTLVICRVKVDNVGKPFYGLSKPCEGCAKCIQEHGIRTVLYTIDSCTTKLSWVTETHV